MQSSVSVITELLTTVDGTTHRFCDAIIIWRPQLSTPYGKSAFGGMVQLERGRRNGFGEAVEQSALATAEKQNIMQTEAALNHFGIAIVEFDVTSTSVMQNLGKAQVFKLHNLHVQPHRWKATWGNHVSILATLVLLGAALRARSGVSPIIVT